jgi:hypothetical protein
VLLDKCRPEGEMIPDHNRGSKSVGATRTGVVGLINGFPSYADNEYCRPRRQEREPFLSSITTAVQEPAALGLITVKLMNLNQIRLCLRQKLDFHFRGVVSGDYYYARRGVTPDGSSS